MKILVSGDTHGNLGHCQYLIRTAKKEQCDRVFVLGDFGYWAHTIDGVKFLDRLDLYANLNNVTVYFLDGNHDNMDHLLLNYDTPMDTDTEGFLRIRNYIAYARRGHRWTWDGIRFIALGGAYSVDKNYRLQLERKKDKSEWYWFSHEEMTDLEMDRILENTDPVDVLLAHDKPRRSNPNWNRKSFLECLPNQDRLQKAVQVLTPTEFWHGHLHYWYRDMFDYEDVDGVLHTCNVQGLHADPDAAETPRYDKLQSWQILDTATIRIRGCSFNVRVQDKDPGPPALKGAGFWSTLSELQREVPGGEEQVSMS